MVIVYATKIEREEKKKQENYFCFTFVSVQCEHPIKITASAATIQNTFGLYAWNEVAALKLQLMCPSWNKENNEPNFPDLHSIQFRTPYGIIHQNKLMLLGYASERPE